MNRDFPGHLNVELHHRDTDSDRNFFVGCFVRSGGPENQIAIARNFMETGRTQKAARIAETELSPFHEKWNLFRKNRSAVISLWFLIFLFVFSIAAILLTQYSKPFDPATVRLSEKFLPPHDAVHQRRLLNQKTDRLSVFTCPGHRRVGTRCVFAHAWRGHRFHSPSDSWRSSISISVGILLGVDWRDSTDAYPVGIHHRRHINHAVCRPHAVLPDLLSDFNRGWRYYRPASITSWS